MPQGDADRIRGYLDRQVKKARENGQTTIIFRAGDVHQALGVTNAYRNVCQVLKGRKFRWLAQVELMRNSAYPPSGEGPSLTVEFRVLP